MAQPSQVLIKKVVESVSDIVEVAVQSIDFFLSTVWWRGHSIAKEYKLIPGVFRKDYLPVREVTINNYFKMNSASRYPKVPEQDDYSSWLFLMQHYRLPTRLLDWTESALIAAFFAVCEHEDKDGELWGLSPINLNYSQFSRRMHLTSDALEINPIFRQAITGENLPDSDNEILAVAIDPPQIDPRLLAQLSKFTIHTTAKSLDTFVNHERFLIKFYIPASSKKKIRDDLDNLGIRRSTLFPDLENLALDIKSKHF